MSFVLPTGLLGILVDGEDTAHSDDDLRHIHGAMRRIAAQSNCTLHEVRTSRLYNTYEIWRLHAGQTPTTCLLVQHFVKVWTVVDEPPAGLLSDDARIVDTALDGEAAFGLLGWTRLTSAMAAAPLEDDTMALLTDSERDEIRYWKAQNVGLALFNDWD